MRLNETKSKTNSDTIVLGNLSLKNIIRDFYQFFQVNEICLWTSLIIEEKICNKNICNQFIFVITLTKQIQ